MTADDDKNEIEYNAQEMRIMQQRGRQIDQDPASTGTDIDPSKKTGCCGRNSSSKVAKAEGADFSRRNSIKQAGVIS